MMRGGLSSCTGRALATYNGANTWDIEMGYWDGILGWGYWDGILVGGYWDGILGYRMGIWDEI